MRLFEMQGKLPEMAGLAKLHWEKDFSIRRSGRDIVLQDYPEAEYYPLKGGDQFLYLRNGTFIFGGTDEDAFLVQIEKAAFSAFALGGEEGFFACLKPRNISSFEHLYQRESKRQGDIFAIAVPYTWAQLEGVGNLIGHRIKGFENDHRSLFDTRHSIKGLWATQMQRQNRSIVLASGTVEAPDHRPLVLDGPHVIEQAQHLVFPAQAD